MIAKASQRVQDGYQASATSFQSACAQFQKQDPQRYVTRPVSWVLQTTPDRLMPCVNRVVSEISPKWKLHQHPTNSFGSGIIIMRPKALLGSTLSHLLVQYTSLPDGYLDVRAAMVKDILSDPDPNHPARVRANVNESMQDFATRLNQEVKPFIAQNTSSP